jgi:hypothetical protein
LVPACSASVRRWNVLGLGGLSSIFGLILQIGLIIIVVRLAMSWWQRRHGTASAYAARHPDPRSAVVP